MSAEDLTPLCALAERFDVTLADSWGCSTVRISGDVDVTALHELADRSGFRVTGFFGDSRLPLVMGSTRPDEGDLSLIAPLAPNERLEAELRSLGTGTEVARALQDQLVEVEVRFERPGWIRTAAAFVAVVNTNWLVVADGLRPGTVTVGEEAIELVETHPATAPAALPVLTPASRVDEPSGAIRLLGAIADAAAWTNLASNVRRSHDRVDVAFTDDEEPRTRVTPDQAEGAVDLLLWTTSSGDANRKEALRYVLMLVTASGPDRLPNAKSVRRLAERQRIALCRDRAAEVQRAISEGQRDAVEALREASEGLGGLLEDTTKTANASILAILGLVVFLASEANRLPGWLVWLATAAAVAGIAFVVRSRWRRIQDHETSLCRVRARLSEDPLLPDEERALAKQAVDDFALVDRAREARRMIAALGIASCVIAVSAAAWLVSTGDTTENADPRTPASTTSTSSATTTVAPPTASSSP